VIDRQTQSLARVFFGRLFENEAFSSSRAAASGLIWLLALIATPGVMFSFLMSLHYSHLNLVPRLAGLRDESLLTHQTLFVDVAMAAALVAVTLVWSSLTPDRKDVMVLGSLPVTPAQQARARLIAIAIFIGLFIIAVSGPTSVAFTLFSRGPREILDAPWHIAGHLAATGLGAAFIFFLMVNVQLVLAVCFGPRAIRLTALPLQVTAVVSVVAALGLGDSIVGGFNAAFDGAAPASIMWNPAAWFVSVYRYIGGDDRPVFALLAQRAVLASAINIAAVLVLYPIAYGRCVRNVIAEQGRRTTKMSRGWARLVAAVLRPLLREPLQRGLAAFMLATLGRSPMHRFIVAMYAGIGFLLSLPLAPRLLQAPATEEQRLAWLMIPLGYVFWMVCGVRVAMMMPAEGVANWIFKLTEPVEKRHVLATIVTVMSAVCVLPISLLFSIALLAHGEMRMAATAFLVVTLAGMCLIELLTLTMKAVPFSCIYLPGQMKLRIYWAPLFFLWINFVFTLGNWSLRALASWRTTAVLLLFLAATWIALHVWHTAKTRKIRGFVYDEQEPLLVTSLLGVSRT
jgi:hypothetical protein